MALWGYRKPEDMIRKSFSQGCAVQRNLLGDIVEGLSHMQFSIRINESNFRKLLKSCFELSNKIVHV